MRVPSGVFQHKSWSSKPDQIYTALDTARKQIEESMGEPFSNPPTLTVTKHTDFWALVELHGDEFHIRISTSVVTAIFLLWKETLKNDVLRKNDGQYISTDINLLTHVSLVWLLLHELSHFTLGHFEITGKHSILETTKGSELSLLSRAPKATPKIASLEHLDYIQIERCFELQADHDAIELMLDTYSKENWSDLRVKIASVATVMILIEKADEENQIEHSTHPKAATRIFQLLGHVTEMWSLPAHAKAKARGETPICEDDLPSDEEKKEFSKEVILPAFWDAVALAEVAEAKSIISDLGSPEDFFADVTRAKLGQWDELLTVGAIEWAELKDANDLILPLLPINQETN